MSKGAKPDVKKDINLYVCQSQPVDIEASAYGVLNYAQQDLTDKALPIVRWLTSQRNSLGGFSSTQVIICLKYLMKFIGYCNGFASFRRICGKSLFS